MVAKARRILDAPPRYLAQVKTDCLLTHGCRSASRSGCGRWRRCATRRARRSTAWKRRSRCWAAAGRRAWRRSAPNNGGGTGWTTLSATAWRATPCCSRAAAHRKDAPGPDHCGEAARAGRGAPGVQDALLCANLGADGRPSPAQSKSFDETVQWIVTWPTEDPIQVTFETLPDNFRSCWATCG